MTENLKSLSITNLDSTPIVVNPTGEGGPGDIRAVNDNVTATTGEAAGSTYRLCRFPCEAKIKHVLVWIDAGVTTLAGDLDIAFSDSTVDGTTVANQGTIPQIASADNKYYGAAVDLHTQTTPKDFVFTPGGAAMNKAAWANMGFVTNPGGYFDLLLKLTSTTSGAPVINGVVEYVL